jgi:hypothetical protein
MEGVVLGEELLVVYNGLKFRHNDLVDVIAAKVPRNLLNKNVFKKKWTRRQAQ